MYSNPVYYALLFISTIIFCIYVSAVYLNNKVSNVELIDISVLDSRAYWVYNNKLYYAKVENDVIDKKSVSIIDTFGMNAEEAYSIFKEKQ